MKPVTGNTVVDVRGCVNPWQNSMWNCKAWGTHSVFCLKLGYNFCAIIWCCLALWFGTNKRPSVIASFLGHSVCRAAVYQCSPQYHSALCVWVVNQLIRLTVVLSVPSIVDSTVNVLSYKAIRSLHTMCLIICLCDHNISARVICTACMLCIRGLI